MRHLVIVWVLVGLSVEPAICKKKLLPIPTATQEVRFFKKKGGHAVAEIKGDIGVMALVDKNDDSFGVFIGVTNYRPTPIEASQERIFLVNAFDNTLYRCSLYELIYAWRLSVNLPPPPAPPPRKYYTITGDTTGNYTIHDLGYGYYGISGFSSSNYTVTENYDHTNVLAHALGTLIGQKFAKRKARKEIERLETSYFKTKPVAPEKYAAGWLFFDAITVSEKTPVTLVLFVDDQKFEFTFDTKKNVRRRK